jgi:hypothetical protein
MGLNRVEDTSERFLVTHEIRLTRSHNERANCSVAPLRAVS